MKHLSIGITTYNNDPFIFTLLYEINQQVKQKPEILEFVDFWIYDDKSTKTEFLTEVPEFFNVVIGTENSGTPATGRNYLINNVKSKYLLFLDGDDIIIRDILDLVLELQSKDKDIFFSHVIKIGADGQWNKSPFLYTNLLEDESTDIAIKEKICVHQTGIWSIYNVEFLRKNNINYEQEMRYEDNYFFFNILLSNPRIGVVSKPYYGWRINYGSFSFSDSSLDSRVALYRKTMELLLDNTDNKFAPYILFSIWNQTYTNIIRNYPYLNKAETLDYFNKLNMVSKDYKQLVKKLKSDADNKYVDSYFKITKLSIFTKFTFINSLKFINRVKNHIPIFKKKLPRLLCKLPLKKDKIVMTSQYGQYGSNPKYLYEQLKAEGKTANVIYFVKDKNLIDGKNFLDYNNKILYYYHTYTAGTVYFDTWIDPFLSKRNNQKWIQMWHGYPFKRVYTDIPVYENVNSLHKHLQKKSNIEKWDEVYSLDKNNTEIFANLFPGVKVIEREYERIEWLIANKDNERLKSEIREKYNLNPSAKFTLYAPTYRPYTVYFDSQDILNLANSENEILFNPHPMLNSNYEHVGVTLGKVDIQEILLICDEVITDYSSIQFDFMKINDKSKVKYYQPDIKLYSRVHGLYESSMKD